MSASLRSLPAWREANVKANPNNYQFGGYGTPRCAHNAVCINEDLIVWGGYNDESTRTLYCENNILFVFNIDLDCWFCYRTNGARPSNRTGAVSVLMWPHWYIIGGNSYDGDVGDISTLNLLTLEWNVINCEPTPIHLLSRDKASAWSWNDRIYIFGGYGEWSQSDIWVKGEDHFVIDNFKGWNDQLLYLDCKTKEWMEPECEGLKPSARAAHSTLCVDDIMYLFGGRHCGSRLNDLHSLDLHSQKWSGKITCFGQLPCERSWHTMTQVSESDLLLYGGFSSSNVPLDDAWILNKDTLSWSQLSKSTGLPRLWHTACANSLGDVLIFGGCSCNILDDSMKMKTEREIILFKRKPFKLVRLCLHAIYEHSDVTKSQWDLLPIVFQEWLVLKTTELMDPFKANFKRRNVVLGHGPCLSGISM